MRTFLVKIVLLIGMFLVLCGAYTAACADCIYAGQSYPTGTVINGYVCKADGTWGR